MFDWVVPQNDPDRTIVMFKSPKMYWMTLLWIHWLASCWVSGYFDEATVITSLLNRFGWCKELWYWQHVSMRCDDLMMSVIQYPVIDINVWMIIGFLLAAFSVVSNDSLQTLGTYISSNRQRTPKSVQMVFVCSVTIFVLFLGWSINHGESAWGRLQLFPVPEPFTWAYIIPPIAVLALTSEYAPVKFRGHFPCRIA